MLISTNAIVLKTIPYGDSSISRNQHISLPGAQTRKEQMLNMPLRKSPHTSQDFRSRRNFLLEMYY
jgi:hypothetical protein